MASPNSSTYDQVPAQRPTVDAFNGCVKVDDQEFPPDPTSMPSAAEANTTGLTMVSVGGMTAVGKVSVVFIGGNPQIAASQFPNIATAFVPSVARTVGGAAAGDITITWPAGAIPAAVVSPSVSLNRAALDQNFLAPTAFAVTNGVRVLTAVSGSVYTDSAFTVVIH